MSVLKLATAAAALAAPVFGHSCDGYQHGHDLYYRDPGMAHHEALLAKRYPEANARVLQGSELRAELARRQESNEDLPASLTEVDTEAVSHIRSGTEYTATISTTPLPTTYEAGSPPSSLPSAPPLPQASIVASDWPELDRPVANAEDDPNVQIWMNQIDWTAIPDYDPTGEGGCSNTTFNQEAIDQAGPDDRCWWTCGGCTRNTDVTFCPDQGTWGLSYDDGPAPYTPKLLNYMDAADLKSTFFVVGSRVISRPEILQYEYMAGHQIAVHTWSHFSLTTLTDAEIVAEFGYSKKAIQEVIGVTPKYMRPPYGDMDDRVRFISMQMGLTPIIWTQYEGRAFDTQDWQIEGGTVNTSTVVDNFADILSMAPDMDNGFIVLEHDLYPQAVDLAVDWVLPNALNNDALTLMPIIECMNMDTGAAYVETAQNNSDGRVPTGQTVGASATDMVQGLTWTPVAKAGDATGPATTLGWSAPASHEEQQFGSVAPGSDDAQDSSDEDSSASALSASVLLSLGLSAVAFLA